MCPAMKMFTYGMDGRCSRKLTVSMLTNERELNSAGNPGTTLLTSSTLLKPRTSGAVRWRERLGPRVTTPVRLRKDHIPSSSSWSEDRFLIHESHGSERVNELEQAVFCPLLRGGGAAPYKKYH